MKRGNCAILFDPPNVLALFARQKFHFPPLFPLANYNETTVCLEIWRIVLNCVVPFFWRSIARAALCRSERSYRALAKPIGGILIFPIHPFLLPIRSRGVWRAELSFIGCATFLLGTADEVNVSNRSPSGASRTARDPEREIALRLKRLSFFLLIEYKK